ncbi:MAG: methyltransferase [Bacteroidia bacterium]|nr:methyltransferase [Bacteroidia bacterium]
MANNYFEFKQFKVYQDKCAMKVGTDGVLLGLLSKVDFLSSTPNPNILDIGAGTGVVSLIAAQRLPNAVITAVEIDADSASQASDNFSLSPFASRLSVIQSDIQNFAPSTKYDLILCNPPFYNGTLTCPDSKRTLARHALSLSFEELASSAARLLSDNGQFSVIIPTYAAEELTAFCLTKGLYANHITKIFPNRNKQPKRVVIQYSRQNIPLLESELIIDDAPSQKSAEFKALVSDYYLRC